MFSMNIQDINSIQIGALRFAFALLLISNGAAESSEWPRFLGPNQNGVLANEALPNEWPSEGPKKLWERNVGSGFAGPIALKERILLFHRQGDQEEILSLDPDSGEEQWRFGYKTNYRDNFGFDNGPRSTPTSSRGHLYTYGAEGRLQCLDIQTGKPIWHIESKDQFNAPNGFFGIACSPLVDGDFVIVNVGSPSSGGIVAFDRLSGAIKWKASRDEASYSSPVAATIAGTRQAIVFDRAGMKAVEITTGKIRSSFPWRPRMDASVNASSPLVFENQVMLTTSYSTGAIVLDLSQPEPRKLWSNDQSISCHYGTPVLHQGHRALFGFHGRQERGANLNCVSWNSGKLHWSESKLEIGTVTLIGNHLLILQENGELVLAKADPQSYQELDRVQILPSGVRAYPAFSDGVIYARSPKKMVAYRLR